MESFQSHSPEAMVIVDAITATDEGLPTFYHHASTHRGLFENDENVITLSYNPVELCLLTKMGIKNTFLLNLIPPFL
jgi:hypothetical protein